MALRGTDWDTWKTAARELIQANPRADHRRASHADRLGCFSVRAAYALVTAHENREGRALGAEPCNRCGLWTHSWCEACPTPPNTAICTHCDGQRRVCEWCEAAGRSWETAHQAQDPNIIEVSGFTDEVGRFHRLDPPLQIPMAEVLTDGTIDPAKVELYTTAYAARTNAQHGPCPEGAPH